MDPSSDEQNYDGPPSSSVSSEPMMDRGKGGGVEARTVGDPRHQVPPREEKREKQKGSAPTSKTCRKCGETKTAADFPRNPRVSDGLSSWCKPCHRAATNAWRERKRAEADRAKRQRVERYCAELAEREKHHERLDRRRARDRKRREHKRGTSAA